MRVTLSPTLPAAKRSTIIADQEKTSSPKQFATIKTADQKTPSAEQNTTSKVVADQKKISLKVKTINSKLKHRPANVSHWLYVPVVYACLHLYHTTVRSLLM